MSCRVAILGGGIWGAAFGSAIAGSCRPYFWTRNPAKSRRIARAAGGEWRRSIAEAAAECDIIIIAASSGGFAEILRAAASAAKPILWLTKGFAANDRLLCETAAEILPSGACFGALSGPTFAQEVKKRLPAAMVVAANLSAQIPFLQKTLHQKMLRLYPSDDLTGVCVCGALKNIIAIAAGISDGMKLGANARAAIITRGLSEMAAFNAALGGRAETMRGVAGVGDLLLTCTSDLSRNRRLGLALGAQKPIPQATAEGAAAAAGALRRARNLGLDTPILAAVCGVLQHALSPPQAAEMLLSRPPPR
ncbi:MAG: NAD(P)H-dependent glycerol-3-phosphate dehydrogenase [Gammaproteobacteria bacterium]